MAALIGTIGPLSTDSNNAPCGPNVWRHRQTLSAGDTLTLTYLGRARGANAIAATGGQTGIIETVALQKVLTTDVVSVSMKTYPASLGATGIPVGSSPAGEAGRRVAAGEVWLSSVAGTLFPAEELVIDNTLGADAVDVTVIVREDL